MPTDMPATMPTLTADRPTAPATFRLDLNVVASIYQPMSGRERRRACRMPRHAGVLLCGPVPVTNAADGRAAGEGAGESAGVGTGSLPTLEAVLQDLSATGIGILYGRPLPAGGRWLVSLPRPGGQPVRLWCEVMRHERVGDSLFHVGLAFRSAASPPLLAGAAIPV